MSDSIKFTLERYIDIKEEIKPIIQSHWEEIALNKDKIALNPDEAMYELLDNNGTLRCYIARDSGKMIGYFVVILSNHMHYSEHIFATNDVIFLSEEYRKTGLGFKMVSFVEDDLKKNNVSVLVINTKVKKPFDSLLEGAGYTCVERLYSKYIGDY